MSNPIDIFTLIDKAKRQIEAEAWLKINYPGCILVADADVGIFNLPSPNEFNRGPRRWIVPNPKLPEGLRAWERLSVDHHEKVRSGHYLKLARESLERAGIDTSGLKPMETDTATTAKSPKRKTLRPSQGKKEIDRG